MFNHDLAVFGSLTLLKFVHSSYSYDRILPELDIGRLELYPIDR